MEGDAGLEEGGRVQPGLGINELEEAGYLAPDGRLSRKERRVPFGCPREFLAIPAPPHTAIMTVVGRVGRHDATDYLIVGLERFRPMTVVELSLPEVEKGIDPFRGRPRFFGNRADPICGSFITTKGTPIELSQPARKGVPHRVSGFGESNGLLQGLDFEVDFPSSVPLFGIFEPLLDGTSRRGRHVICLRGSSREVPACR
jgi:hypothetical protein